MQIQFSACKFRPIAPLELSGTQIPPPPSRANSIKSLCQAISRGPRVYALSPSPSDSSLKNDTCSSLTLRERSRIPRIASGSLYISPGSSPLLINVLMFTIYLPKLETPTEGRILRHRVELTSKRQVELDLASEFDLNSELRYEIKFNCSPTLI